MNTGKPGKRLIGPTGTMAISNLLNPSALHILFFVLILMLQAAFSSSGMTTYSLENGGATVSVRSFGVGFPFAVTNDGSAWSIKIKWGILIINLAACYVLSLLLSGLVRKITRLQRPARIYLFTALSICLVAFVVSIILSRLYWGYYFFRPPLLPETATIAKVKAVFPVATEEGPSGEKYFIIRKKISLQESISFAERDPYDGIDERILVSLDRKGLLPPDYSEVGQDLSGLYSIIQTSGLMEAPDEGYNFSDMLRGIVVDAQDGIGQRLVFVGVTGGQLSNDHYPYYECILKETANNRRLSFIRGRRFFYDVAGIEGCGWYIIWPYLFLAGVMIVLPILTIVIGMGRVMKKCKKRRREMIHLVIVALMAFGISCSVRGNAEKGGVETGSPVAAAAQSYLPEATTPEGLYREGGRLCRKGRNADALTTYRALIERFPEQNRAGCAAIYLAGLQLSGKNYQEAIETLTLAAEKYDQDRYGDGVEVGGYAYFLLAKAYCETGEYEKAAASLRNLVDKFPYASGHRSGDALMSIRAKRWFYDTLTENGIDLSFLDNLIARQKEGEFPSPHGSAACSRWSYMRGRKRAG